MGQILAIMLFGGMREWSKGWWCGRVVLRLVGTPTFMGGQNSPLGAGGDFLFSCLITDKNFYLYTMETLTKKNIRREGNQVIIELPESFHATQVDVLVYPSQVEEKGSPSSSMSDYLAEWPDLPDNDLKYIEEKRKHLQAWI